MGTNDADINTKRRYKPKNKWLLLGSIAGVFLICGQIYPIQAVEFTLNPNTNKEIVDLNEQINSKRKEIDALNKQADQYAKSLASKRREIATLSYQISTINQTITKLTLEKEALELKIDEIQLQTENTLLKIQATEQQIAMHKEQMAELIRTLYRNDKSNNIIAVLATNTNLSDYLSQIQNLQNIQDQVLGGLNDLGTLRVALVDEKNTLDKNKQDAEKLQSDLQVKAATLEDQKNAKFDILDQSRGEESKYQQMIQDLKNEQSRINSDIVRLEQVAREKLNRQLKTGQDLGSGPMTWPIPSRTITATFHDPDYPFRNIFEHPAIDIRTPQGTQIRAAASGYVARAKDSGMGYSYVMLVHDNGLATVYGHVSSILATEGTFVTQGQIIALSGGTPHTPGAGPLTTGPHLHFEVRLNGIPVNPLNYLPQ